MALLEPATFSAPVESVRRAELVSVDESRRELCWTVWLKGFELTWRETQRLDAAA